MTRETKIGLLVGLAFILVVGILLSEHLQNATERPAAALADAGHGVRAGVSTPGMAGMEDAAPLRAAEPQQPVPMARDLTPAPAPVAHVTIGGETPAQQQPPSIVVRDENSAVAQQPQQQTPAATDTPVITKLPTTPAPTDPFANDPIAKAAASQGEAIVPVDTKGSAAQGKSDKTVAMTTSTTAAREYKAQAGDTLSRIAALLPGGSTKANRDAVVKLNPTLQKDPNKVICGHTYLLPTADKTASATPSATTPVANTSKPAATKTPAPIETASAPATTADPRIYVVKAGDTLTKIALAECGSKSQVAILKKLNDDILKGTDAIRVDMKLKLPAKSATAAS